jgi:hypothetical protein
VREIKKERERKGKRRREDIKERKRSVMYLMSSAD